jgi:hypothetical protein
MFKRDEECAVLAISPSLPVQQDNARAVTQAFCDRVAVEREQQRTTATLASQLRQDIQQKIADWTTQDQQQFMQWFNQALREVNVTRIQAIPAKKYFGFYFAILAGILAVGFIFFAVFAALIGKNVFNGW